MKVWALNFGVSDNLGARKGYLLGNHFWCRQKGYLLGNHFDCGSKVISSYYNYYGDIGPNLSYLHNSNENYILVINAVFFKKKSVRKKMSSKSAFITT